MVPLYESSARASTSDWTTPGVFFRASWAAHSRRQTLHNGVVFRAHRGWSSKVIESFCDWLSNTPLSLKIQTVMWIIPAVQTIHILCVAIVMSSMVMLDFRLIGVAGRKHPISRMVSRFVPWVWGALPVLLTTGIILIIGEPSRELLNPYFRAKMLMLTVVIAITFVVQRQNRKDAAFWEARRVAAALTGVASLLLWVGIVSAGRWIAYY
jgi:uncharacterized membrane protein SirB2